MGAQRLVGAVPNLAFTKHYGKPVKALKTDVTVRSTENFSKAATVVGLWDTGATCTCISREVAETLELQQIGATSLNGATGVGSKPVYMIHLELPNGVTFPTVEAIESEIGDLGIGVLVGMNIITAGDFAVSTNDGETRFSFRIPSRDNIDYNERTNYELGDGEYFIRGPQSGLA